MDVALPPLPPVALVVTAVVALAPPVPEVVRGPGLSSPQAHSALRPAIAVATQAAVLDAVISFSRRLPAPLGCSLQTGFLTSGSAETILDRPDPGCIVIDEIAGFMVALLGIPFSPHWIVTGFFIFRIMDILKPPPIRYLDKNIPGGTGVVVDDLAAGIYSNLILRGLIMLSA